MCSLSTAPRAKPKQPLGPQAVLADPSLSLRLYLYQCDKAVISPVTDCQAQRDNRIEGKVGCGAAGACVA